MNQAMGGMSHYLARDERIWVYLTHTTLLSYARTRWPIPEDNEKAVKHIKSHFFASVLEVLSETMPHLDCGGSLLCV